MIGYYKDDVKIDGKMKTKIRNDLLAEFSEYQKSSSCSLEKRVGCLSLGIGYYINHGTDIRFQYSTFNLSNPLDFMCANLSTEPKNRWKINWLKYEKGLYKEMTQELRDLAPIPIEGDVQLSQIIKGYKIFIKNNEYERDERHFEDPALIAAWCGRLDVAKDCLNWGLDVYKSRCTIPNLSFSTFDEWYAHMLTRISDTEALRQIVEEQVIHHKLQKIPYQEIIIDV